MRAVQRASAAIVCPGSIASKRRSAGHANNWSSGRFAGRTKSSPLACAIAENLAARLSRATRGRRATARRVATRARKPLRSSHPPLIQVTGDRPALRTSMRSWVGAPPSIRPSGARSVTSTPSNVADASIGPVVGCAATLVLGAALGPALGANDVGGPRRRGGRRPRRTGGEGQDDRCHEETSHGPTTARREAWFRWRQARHAGNRTRPPLRHLSSPDGRGGHLARYGRHAATVLRAGPALTTTASAGSFTAFSGAPHVGFVVIDDVEAWTLGASDQDMDAVGAG